MAEPAPPQPRLEPDHIRGVPSPAPDPYAGQEPSDFFFGRFDREHPPGTTVSFESRREPGGILPGQDTPAPAPGPLRGQHAVSAPARATVRAAGEPGAPAEAIAALAGFVAARSGSRAAGRAAGREAPGGGPTAPEIAAGTPTAMTPRIPLGPGGQGSPGELPAPSGSAPPSPSAGGARERRAPAPATAPAESGALTGAEEIRARAAAAAGALRHPTAPSRLGGAPALRVTGVAITRRGAAQAQRAAAAPGQIAGRPPVPRRAPPHPDPGPIPAEMEAIRAKSGRPLPPAALPAVPASPRGTLPNPTGPILSTEEIQAIRIGEAAINALTPDPAQRTRLMDLRNSMMSGTTATTAAPDTAPGAVQPAAAPLSIQDEPVAALTLDPQQRAIFTRVIGELRRDVHHEAVEIFDAIRNRHRLYPNGLLTRWFPHLGEEMEPNIEGSVAQHTSDLANALGLVPDQIDAAIAQRRTEIQSLAEQASQSTSAAAAQAQSTATVAASRTIATARRTGAATARAVAADRPAPQGRAASVRARIEHAIDEIRHQISTERARYDAQRRNRERAIANAVSREVTAIRVAQARDELALEHAGAADFRENQAQARRWADTQVAALQEGYDSAPNRLNREALAATDTFKNELDTAGATAFGALRDWADRQSIATEDWWTSLHADLDVWATNATERSRQWELERGEEARLALAQDLAAVTHIVELQHQHDTSAVNEYIGSLDAESRAVVLALSRSAQGGAADLTGALSAGLLERVRAAEQVTVEDELQTRLLNIKDTEDNEDTLTGLRGLVAATDHGMEIKQRVADIHESVTRWRGFDEQKIFHALEGLTPVGGVLLRLEYRHAHDQSLDEALHGHGHAGWLDADEYRTAQEMLLGGADATVNGAVGAINSAITGLGTDKEAIKRILRSLTDEQRRQVLTRYRDRYGEGLDTAIRGEWISTSQQDEIVALSESRGRDADAIALGRSVETHYTDDGEGGGGGERYATIDRSDAQAVFAQVRGEVEAEGARRNWTTAQIEAEITLRGREIERQFNVRFSGEWWAAAGAPGTSAMRQAFNLESGAGRDLLNAVADNDLTRMDIARLQLEDQGIYAEDAAINAVFRDQNTRSFAEVNRDLGPFLRARADARLNEESQQPGRFPTEEARLNRRMELERETSAELTRVADERTKSRMAALDAGYHRASGRFLDDMVEANMSGASRDEARVRVAQNGVVTSYQRVRFAIDGIGTDLPMLRSALSSMTPEELRRAREQWPQDHDGETLEQGISGDTSGRDEDDLLDLVRVGPPQTVGDAVAAAQRRYDRDRRGGGAIGEWLTSDEVAEAGRDVSEMQAALTQIRRTDLSPAERDRAGGRFDLALDRANLSIEIQRNAVDAWADTLSNAAAMVVAVVVGAAIEFFSGGTATPLVIAVVSSLVATAASMATKRLVKGTAYGREEFETDLAVGAADALMAALTAGLGNALLGEASRGAQAGARSGLGRTLGEMGRLTGRAARAESRFAALVSRGPTVGVFARSVERSGLTEGLGLASRPWLQRTMLRGAAQLVEGGIQALPSSFVGSLADERVWREPGGGPLRVVNNTLSGAAHSSVMGLGFAAAHATVGHMVGGVVRALRGTTPELRIPAGDVLGGLGTPRERMAEFRTWQGEHPEGSYHEFYAERQQQAIERQGASVQAAEQVRRLRRELLAELPPRERGAYADIPILTATEAELRRLVPGTPGDAHLIVRNGEAVIVVRDGAPAGSVRPLTAELQNRVFPHSGGLTLEGALPPHLRDDVVVRRDASLATDTVLVVPVPRDGGPIRGVEVVVGPGARPIDVALHAETVERVRRWAGRTGEARLVLADAARALGFSAESPRDRVRFEAAEEVRKLGPIIDERIRRFSEAAYDPQRAARLEAEVSHLLAQQERARRILSGQLETEARGYIAAEGLAPAPPERRFEILEAPETVMRGRRASALRWHVQEAGAGAPRQFASQRANQLLGLVLDTHAEGLTLSSQARAEALVQSMVESALARGATSTITAYRVENPAGGREAVIVSRTPDPVLGGDRLNILVFDRAGMVRGGEQTVSMATTMVAAGTDIGVALRELSSAGGRQRLGLRSESDLVQALLAVREGRFDLAKRPGPRYPRVTGEAQTGGDWFAGAGRIERASAVETLGGARRYQISGIVDARIPRVLAPSFEETLRLGSKLGIPGLGPYERCHLWGPGFGDEARLGLMYGPKEINQLWQNERAEAFIRLARDTARQWGGVVRLTATAHSFPRELLPPALRSRREPFLRSASYSFTIEDPITGRVKHEFSLSFEVSPPPNGRIIRDSLAASGWGPDTLLMWGGYE